MHPNAEHVAAVLRERGVAGTVRELTTSARTAAEAAASLGVPVGAIANSLVFSTAFGEPLLVLASGAHRVDTSWLGQRIGVALRQADADLVRAATGQPIGGVSPVGHPEPIRTMVDTALRDHAVVWAAAGTPHAVFPTTFDELVTLTNGEPTEVDPY